MTEFKCLRCGNCCKSLLREIYSGLFGLTLSVEEAKRFPKELVLPRMGVGYWGGDQPKHIVFYQLTENVCRFISAKNRCMIYRARPLGCKAFPLTSMGSRGVVTANDCLSMKGIERRIRRTLDGAVAQIDFVAPDEWKAINKVDARILKSLDEHAADVQFLWYFDFKSKEWVLA